MARDKGRQKKRGFIRRGIGSMFNVKRWVAWDQIVVSSKAVKSLGKSLFVPQKAKHHETFAEAVERLQLSEKDIAERQKAFLRLAIIYALFSLALFIYFIVVLFNGSIVAAFLSLVLSALIAVYAYREHFWYTQIKYRKFGLSFHQWRWLTFKGGYPPEKKQ